MTTIYGATVNIFTSGFGFNLAYPFFVDSGPFQWGGPKLHCDGQNNRHNDDHQSLTHFSHLSDLADMVPFWAEKY